LKPSLHCAPHKHCAQVWQLIHPTYSWWNSHTKEKVRVGRFLIPQAFICLFVHVLPILPSLLQDIILKCTGGSGQLTNTVSILHAPSGDAKFCEKIQQEQLTFLLQ
jgi:hypothetical protein